MANFKERPWRSQKYLKWVRGQPCVITGQQAEPHHIIGHGFSGMGTKAPDWACLPLCREIHNELHHSGFKQWETQYGSQLYLFMRFWAANFTEIKDYL